jgi:anaerobic magnesium-protoporphyrin IX monomethyl ester cyclase
MSSVKHICLITPPSPFLLDERVFMHIGVLKIAAILEQRGYKVDFIDLSGISNFTDVLADYIKLPNSAKVFGVTATTPQVPFAVKIARTLKGKVDKLILGGPHVSLMHSAAKKEKERNFVGSDRATKDIKQLLDFYDVLVCGDGELAIFEAFKIEKGIIDADDRRSPLFLSNEQFTTFPLPARHLVDVGSYKYQIEGENAISLIAQLGCPFFCTFCSGRNSPFLRKIRTRGTDAVVKEIEHLYLKYGFKAFMFYDDELNVNKNMVPMMNQISDLQEKHGVDFKLRGFIKAELFNEVQAQAMYRAGFRWILTGFESGDERILTNIKKRASKDDNTRCVEIAKKHGLKVKALMSIGHGGESPETIENTKNWLLKAQPEEFDCTIITTYPGSPYFDEAVKHGDHYVYTSDISGDKLYQKPLNYLTDQDYYKGDPSGGYISYVWTDYISAENLVKERNLLEKEVREKLSIPFNSARAGIKYEHSMGQGNLVIPEFILRQTKKAADEQHSLQNNCTIL